MIAPHADVAELADAQVSEACDGDIVEVQVLSSAPTINGKGEPECLGSPFSFPTRIDFSGGPICEGCRPAHQTASGSQ